MRPAYVSDDEVDENGNPLTDEDAETPANDDASQVPIEASIDPLRPRMLRRTAATRPRRSKLFDSVPHKYEKYEASTHGTV